MRLILHLMVKELIVHVKKTNHEFHIRDNATHSISRIEDDLTSLRSWGPESLWCNLEPGEREWVSMHLAPSDCHSNSVKVGPQPSHSPILESSDLLSEFQCTETISLGIYLVVLWLRICLAVRGIQVHPWPGK